MGVINWGNKGSVIKGDVDVAISCRGGSNSGSVVGPAWGLNPRVTVSRGVMGVSDWGNKGSVIKGDIDVAISCGWGSDGGSVAGIE